MPSKILMEFCCVGVRLVVKKEILVNFPSTARKSPLAHRPHGHTGIAVLPAARCLPPPVANGARRHGAVGSMYGKTEDLSWSKKSLSFSNVAPSGRLRRLHAAPPTLASCRSCARVRWPWVTNRVSNVGRWDRESISLGRLESRCALVPIEMNVMQIQ